MKTFTKPEWYNTIKLSKSRSQIMTHYFQNKMISHPKEEICTTLAPFWSEYFLSAIGSNGPLIEACRFKDMPSKKFSGALERSVSAPVSDCVETEDVDNMIIDDDEDY